MEFAERATIIEFDGGFCRAEAERLGLEHMADRTRGLIREYLTGDER